jgi:hypothetical protein
MAAPFAAGSPDPEVPVKVQKIRSIILDAVERATGHDGIGAVGLFTYAASIRSRP